MSCYDLCEKTFHHKFSVFASTQTWDSNVSDEDVSVKSLHLCELLTCPYVCLTLPEKRPEHASEGCFLLQVFHRKRSSCDFDSSLPLQLQVGSLDLVDWIL